jgi:hypothetical protein
MASFPGTDCILAGIGIGAGAAAKRTGVAERKRIVAARMIPPK